MKNNVKAIIRSLIGIPKMFRMNNMISSELNQYKKEAPQLCTFLWRSVNRIEFLLCVIRIAFAEEG